MADVATCTPIDVTHAWKGIAYETGLIQAHAEYRFRRNDAYIKGRIPVRAGNPEEGCDPIEHVEYHFNLIDDDYSQIQSCGPDADATVNIPSNCDPCAGSEQEININEPNNLMCDLPTAVMTAGYNKYSGVQYAKAVESPPVCALNLMRKKHLGFYVNGLRRAMPREMNTVYERKLEQLVIDYGRYNTGEAAGSLLLGNGSIPVNPTGTADYGTFLQMAEILRANGWTGPVIFGIGHSSLQNMIFNTKVSSGVQLESKPFTTDDLMLAASPGDLVMVGDIGFKILMSPPKGYIQQIGANTYQFVHVDPRMLQPGTGAGITAEFDASYLKAWVTCHGQTYPLVELSFFIHPSAAYIQPFAMKQIPGVPIEGRFNMEVRVIRGAFLECNKDDTKFLFRALHYFKFVPVNPRLMGVIAHLYAPYNRYLHIPSDPDITPEAIIVNSPQLCPPFDNSCCDIAGGSDPTQRKAVVPTEDEPNPVNGVGQFRVVCTVRAVAGGTTIDICAERFGGSSGVATLRADTSNGTATAGVNYTAVVAEILSWAAGEFGVKCFTVAGLVNATADDLTFDVDWTLPVGATLVADFCPATTVTIPGTA